MTIVENRRNRRGSALMMTYLAALLLSFLVIYGYQASVSSGNASKAVANAERTDYAAEYAASLAVAELPNVQRGANGKITADWVGTNLFTDKHGKAGLDQRRIVGDADGQQFRVLVRSARDAFAQGTNPDNWINDKGFNGDYIYGEGNDARFKNTYEILATARPESYVRDANRENQLASPTLATFQTSSLYGIVEMNFTDNPGVELEDHTVLNLDNGRIFVNSIEKPPVHLQMLKSNQAYAAFQAPPPGDPLCYSIGTVGGVHLSGEDHNLTTVFPKLTVDSGTNLTGAQRVSISDGKFVAATGGYWTDGHLTLNFLQDSRGVDKESSQKATKNRDVYTPVRPNPHVPLTKSFTDSYVASNPGHDDRQMTSKFARLGSGFYINDYYDNSSHYGGLAKAPKSQDRLAAADMPVDPYFLGGKKINSGGRTVNFQDENLYQHGYMANSDELYRGIYNSVTKKYSGVIKESKASQFTAAKPLDVAVGNYEDLKRFYITYCPGTDAKAWRTTFVGEWTDAVRKPGDSSTPHKMLFDNNGGTPRRRSFSKHFPMNKEGKILVHEMQVYEPSTRTMRAVKNSSESPNVWTGRYRWVDVDFSGKFNWKDRKTGVNVYPREFTWEEITAQKTMRFASGSGGGLSVAGGVYERDKETGIISPSLSSTVKIEGYPICDTIGREVPELDADDQPIHVGLTEYCSVNASDRGELIPVVFYNASGIDAFGVMNEVKKTGKQTRLKAFENKVRQFARRDFIEVVNDDNSISYFHDISDFEFESEVTWFDEEGVSHTEMRRTAAITVGIEDLPEDSSDFDYTDMMFVLNVMPATKGGGAVVEQNTESSRFVQWWMLEPEQGLTGQKSKTALSSTQLPNTAKMDDEVRHRINYEYILDNGNSIINAQSFVTKVTEDSGAELTVKYYRAQFDEHGDLIVPEFADGENKEVYYYMATQKEYWDMPHAEKYDDLFAYINIMADDSGLTAYMDSMMANKTHPDLVDASGNQSTGNMRRKQIARLKMIERCQAAGVELMDIRDRIQNAGDLIENFLYWDWNEDGGEEKVNRNLYKVREQRYTSRRQASLIFGGDATSVQTIDTTGYLEPDRDDDGILAGIEKEQLLFIGGELPPNHIAPIPYADVAMRQPEGTMMLSALENDMLPGLIITADDNSYDSTERAVDLLYEPLPEDSYVKSIRALFSIDDNRYQLGWHRSGTDLEKAQGTNLLLDCYRAVMLTAKDIQPYTLAYSTPGDIPNVIAKVRTMISDGTFTNGDVLYEHMTQIDTGSKLPTFTFLGKNNSGIDGAGVMVVNGNLQVLTDFSYYGLLIVLGDVIIKPEPGMYYLKDGSGNFLGADGNKVYRNSDGRWFRMAERVDESELGEDGLPLTWIEPDFNDANGVAVEPAITEQYKGELIVQGHMLVGGNIFVENSIEHVAAENEEQCPGGNQIIHNGSMKVWGSEAAREMVENYLRDSNGGEIGRFTVNKSTWNTHATNYVEHIWENTLK